MLSRITQLCLLLAWCVFLAVSTLKSAARMPTLRADSLVHQVSSTCAVGRHSSHTCTMDLTHQRLHRDVSAAGGELGSKDAEAEV